MQKWFREHSKDFQGDLRFSENLASFTYYKLGGPADVVVAPKTESDLQWLSQGLRETSAPLFILGAGSNVLISDQGFRGVVVRSARMNSEIQAVASNRIRVGASVTVAALLRRSAQAGWSGLEFLTGVPGTIGGVVKMNAGTHLGEAKDRLLKVESFCLQGEVGSKSFEGTALRFDYRRNLFLPVNSLVTATEWAIDKSSPAEVKVRIDELLLRRKNTQPVDLPSCGSVFKNPKSSGLHAWQVIEKLGLKGHRIGGAEISVKHSNFIVNLGTARAQDVLDLINLAKRRARDELSIELEEEVKLVGF